MIYLVALLTAVATALLVYGLAGAVVADRGRALRYRLATIRGDESAHHEVQERRRRQAKRDRIEVLLETLGEKVSGERRSRGVREQLMLAGFRRPNAGPLFVAVRLVAAAALAGGVLFAAPLLGLSVPQTVALVTLGALLGWKLPFTYLRRRIKRRQNAMRKGLPDALDLLVVCVEAGMGLNQALLRVGEELDGIFPELGDELTFVSLEIGAGTPRVEALRNLARRTGLSEVSSLVSLLVQTDRFGTSIADALRVHSEDLRTKRIQRAEEAGAKTTIKMLIPLVLFVFPAIFVVILGPSVFHLMTLFRGI